MQRLRTVTSLDVSAVAGHHAMPAALLLHRKTTLLTSSPICALLKWGIFLKERISSIFENDEKFNIHVEDLR